MKQPRETQPRWFKFWKRSNEEQLKAIQKLTEALAGLEQARQEGNKALQEMMQPERLGQLMAQAMEASRALTFQVAPPFTGREYTGALPAGAPGPVPAFSPEVIKEAMDTVTRAVMGKMAEMQAHIAEAVKELPPNIIKQIAEKLQSGEDFTLRRRHGCVHIDFGYGDSEYYLRL